MVNPVGDGLRLAAKVGQAVVTGQFHRLSLRFDGTLLFASNRSALALAVREAKLDTQAADGEPLLSCEFLCRHWNDPALHRL